jgi:hypothetical protein
MTITLDKAALRSALEVPDPYVSLVKHPLPKCFILTRDFKRLMRENPPTGYSIPSGASIKISNSWSITILNIPPGGEAYIYWDLPEPAKEVYVQWATENTYDGVYNELRLIDKTTGNFVFQRKDTAPSAGDHKVGKVIGGVETVVATEVVDLTYNSPTEFAFLINSTYPREDNWYYHAYRGRDGYGTAIIDQIAPETVKPWGFIGVTNTQISKIDRVMFYTKNGASITRPSGLIQMHFDTLKPFCIYYDTEGEKSYP